MVNATAKRTPRTQQADKPQQSTNGKHPAPTAERQLAATARRRASLEAALKEDKASIKSLEKAVARHKAQLKKLRSDLADIDRMQKKADKHAH